MPATVGYNFTLGATLAPSFQGAMNSARSEISGLARSVRGMQSSQTGTLGASFEASRSKVAGLGRELKSARSELAQLRAREQAAGQASGTLARQIAQTESRVKSLTGKLHSASNAYKDTIARTQQASGSIGKLRKDYQGLAQDMARAEKRQRALSAHLARKDALRDQRSDLQGRLVGTVGLAMGAKAAPDLAIGFEDSMARVRALSNATDEELSQLTAQARQLGRDTVYTASQAAEGMGYLAMAGFDTQQTLAAMPGMLQLAAAGNTDLGRTADIASNILSGFKMKADEMGIAADALAKTFTSSNTTLETLGESMKYVGPVASTVGISMQDMSAAVGLLGNVGIQGSQAGTALRAALLRLAAPPKMAREALAELTGASGPELDELAEQMEDVAGASQTLAEIGVQTKDAAGNLRPLADILEDLNAGTAQMGSAEKAEVFKNVFGTEASAAMIALADQAGKTVDDMGRAIVDGLGRPTTALRQYMEEINQAGGTAARISAQMNATTGGALRGMTSALQDAGISVGNLFLPAITAGAHGVKKLANGVSWLVQEFPTLSTGVAYVGGGIVALAVGSLALGYAFNTVRTGLNIARGALLLFSGAERTAAGATRTLTIWQRLSRLATLSWSDVLSGARGGVAGLAGSVARFAGIQRGATAATVAYTVAQRVMGLGGAIAGKGLRILGLATRFALGPIGLIVTALGLAVGLIIDNWDTVGPYFTALWDGIVGVFKGAWTFIGNIVDGIVGLVKKVIGFIEKIPIIGSAVRGLGKGFGMMFGGEDDASPADAGSLPPQAAALAATSAVVQAAGLGTAAPSAPASTAPAPAASTGAATLQSEAVVPQRASSSGTTSRASSDKMEFFQDIVAGQGTGEADAYGDMSAREMDAYLAQAPASSLPPASGGSPVSLTMQFQVQGLDLATFRSKMEECRGDFEKIVRRVLDEMQHNKLRTSYAQ